MADLGEGPGEPPHPYFSTKMRTEGAKKNFETAPPPPPHPHLSQTIDDRASPLSERLDPPLQTFSKPRAIFNKKLKKRVTRNVMCIHMPVLS